MNNRGFTLIELIATIALLAVIAVISYVSINTVISNNKVNNCETLVQTIKTAAKEYVSDNRYVFSDRNDKHITTKNLIDGKYLSGPINNPFDTNNVISSDDMTITIKLNSDYSAGEIYVYNKNGNLVNCESGTW